MPHCQHTVSFAWSVCKRTNWRHLQMYTLLTQLLVQYTRRIFLCDTDFHLSNQGNNIYLDEKCYFQTFKLVAHVWSISLLVSLTWIIIQKKVTSNIRYDISLSSNINKKGILIPALKPFHASSLAAPIRIGVPISQGKFASNESSSRDVVGWNKIIFLIDSNRLIIFLLLFN